MSAAAGLPRWAEFALLPALGLALAFAVSAVVVALAGFDPWQVLVLIVRGAFGSKAGVSYTAYYATSFVCTGLAVALALHAGLFNIGAEGQATLGGLGAGLAALAWSASLPPALMLPLMGLAALAFGAAWALVPALLQAWRGSHVVITTIMFNFVAAALLGYLLVGPLKAPGDMNPESAEFAASARLPGMHELLGACGLDWPRTPLNASLLVALAAAVAVEALLSRSLAGYALRTTGAAPEAARYAGMRPRRTIVLAMAASGALAGLVGVNEIAGVQGRLVPDFVAGAGFTGIAVSLIGRNRPAGIVLAALLFGALYQGGAELAFELPDFSREMVYVLQGLVVLFAGALPRLGAPLVARVLRAAAARRERAGLAETAGG